VEETFRPTTGRLTEESLVMGRCLFRVLGLIGAGKTVLIRRTHEVLGGRVPVQIAYRPGRIAERDARYLERTGLSAHMIPEAEEANDLEFHLWPLLPQGGAVFLEERASNNPPRLRFGHEVRIWVQSVVGGEEILHKYPEFIEDVDLVLINHMDLLPFTEFSLERFQRGLRSINSEAELLGVSCRTGVGLEAWRDWLLVQTGLPVKETGEVNTS
jgi:hydrogenase nickel incorporation protein HypB